MPFWDGDLGGTYLHDDGLLREKRNINRLFPNDRLHNKRPWIFFDGHTARECVYLVRTPGRNGGALLQRCRHVHCQKTRCSVWDVSRCCSAGPEDDGNSWLKPALACTISAVGLIQWSVAPTYMNSDDHEIRVEILTAT